MRGIVSRVRGRPQPFANHSQILTAAAQLKERGGQIDYLLLNAGMMGSATLTRTKEGIELAAAASLVGHHVLTMQLLDDALLSPKAHIVISGSEAARGDVPMMTLTDVPEFADKHTGGDRVAAVVKMLKGEEPYVYANTPNYAHQSAWSTPISTILPARKPLGRHWCS